MTEAVDRSGELVADADIGIGIVAVMPVIADTSNAADQSIGELREDDPLILRLVDDLRRLCGSACKKNPVMGVIGV